MCLGVPGKVIEKNETEQWAVIEAYGTRNRVDTQLVDEGFGIGDFLMVHAGYAIGRIDTEEAQETLKMLEEIVV